LVVVVCWGCVGGVCVLVGGVGVVGFCWVCVIVWGDLLVGRVLYVFDCVSDLGFLYLFVIGVCGIVCCSSLGGFVCCYGWDSGGCFVLVGLWGGYFFFN
jgi:hypothetical protein